MLNMQVMCTHSFHRHHDPAKETDVSFPADQTVQLKLELGPMVCLRALEQPVIETGVFRTAIGGKEERKGEMQGKALRL